MLYRPFFLDAWRLTRERKRLWIFGLFAALLSTGGVVDAVWRTLSRVERTESLLENLADASFTGYAVAASYIGQLVALGGERSSLILALATLMGIALLIIATLSQGALILGIGSRHREDPYVLRRQAASHFWSLLLVGILNKILMGLLLVLMTLPLWLISLSTAPAHVALFLILLCAFISCAVIVNILYVFALIEIVDRGAPPLHAIHIAAQLFARQWLAALEYGLLLFFLVFSGGVIFLASLSLLLIPYSLLFTAGLLTGSFSAFLAVNVLGVLLLLAALLVFIGASVTFQYSAWYAFYKRGVHKTHGKKVFSKILRLAYR